MSHPQPPEAPSSQVDPELLELEALFNEAGGANDAVEDEFTQILTEFEKQLEPRSFTEKSAIAANAAENEFADLEKLLEQADKPIASVNRAYSYRQAVEPTMRVPIKPLDNIGQLVGELANEGNTLKQDGQLLRQFLDNLLDRVQQLSYVTAQVQELSERSLPTPPEKINTPIPSLCQTMTQLMVQVQEAALDIKNIADKTYERNGRLHKVANGLQDSLKQARMVSFSKTSDRLQRAVREISLRHGKQVELHVAGKETLIDKLILEHLYDPLTAILDKTIHAIEPPEERIAAGKSPTGRIDIQAFHQGDRVVISISDDGRGIDPERIKASAIRDGLITPDEAKGMSPSDAFEFLFFPGFSMKLLPKMDEFSGGCGRFGGDVIRNALSEIEGVISVDSGVGKGTTTTIRLPLNPWC
jgi:chemosensory pili system protein ChpA (sensor histidine kinase/response regulator)